MLFQVLTVWVLHVMWCEGGPIDVHSVDWNAQAQETLTSVLAAAAARDPRAVAHNVVLFLGDGMGLSTTMAARVLKGQQRGQPGEEATLVFERFPHVAMSKTYNTNRQVADSAATATAFLSGVKAQMGTLGVDQGVSAGNTTVCGGDRLDRHRAESIVRWSQREGKASGVVTTTRVTHATPAAAYAASPHRDWEAASPADGCDDIATQLVHADTGSALNVVLGGGRAVFTATNVSDPEYSDVRGRRQDGRNLIQEWQDKKRAVGASYAYVWNKEQFDNIDPNTKYVLGLFEPSHMQYESERSAGAGDEPSLADMTRTAVRLLLRAGEGRGFFLLVEGGRIDHAHHNSQAARALTETLSLDEAVGAALDELAAAGAESDTLVVVTADHSHTLTVSGYPSRGNPILGVVDVPMDSEYTRTLDGLPYATLTYANGPGGIMPGQTRANLTGAEMGSSDPAYVVEALVPMKYETHAGEDVAVYATGPGAHLFSGVQEQNYIAHAMAYASCVGRNKNHCQGDPAGSGGSACLASWTSYLMALLLLSLNRL